MPLSEEHRRYLVVDQSLHPAIFNLVLNGGIAWLIFRHNEVLTIWDEAAVGPDLLITGFLLAFLSCVIVSRVIRGQIEGGKLSGLPIESVGARGLHLRSPLVRGLVLGVVGLFLGAMPAIAVLHLVDAAPMSVGWFVTFKAVWTGVLAAAITPIIAWWTLQAAAKKTAASPAQA